MIGCFILKKCDSPHSLQTPVSCRDLQVRRDVHVPRGSAHHGYFRTTARCHCLVETLKSYSGARSREVHSSLAGIQISAWHRTSRRLDNLPACCDCAPPVCEFTCFSPAKTHHFKHVLFLSTLAAMWLYYD